MPMKCLGIVSCNGITLLFLFRAADGSDNEQHTGGWSAVVRVRQQSLRQGPSIRPLLLAEWWQFHKWNLLPPEYPVLEEEQRCWWPSLPLPKVHFLPCDWYRQQSDKPLPPLPPLFLLNIILINALSSVAFQLMRTVCAGHLALPDQGLLTEGTSWSYNVL